MAEVSSPAAADNISRSSLEMVVLATSPSNFDHIAVNAWFRTNWTLSIPLAVLYILLVHSGQYCMTSRKKYDLRRAMIIWNIALAIFSLFGSLASILTFIEVMNTTKQGFLGTLCYRGYHLHPLCGFWIFAYVASKAVEFGDTFFIVAQKQKLIFLHWYHHAITLIMCCWGYGHLQGLCSVIGVMNYSVHVLMYGYYAARAAGKRIPAAFKKLITAIQLLQMILGIFTCVYLLWELQDPNVAKNCSNSKSFVWAMVATYASFAVLFANFYRKSYSQSTKLEHVDNKLKAQ